jgi:hypothetical protein
MDYYKTQRKTVNGETRSEMEGSRSEEGRKGLKARHINLNEKATMK